jgi:hypothetical protein
LETLFFRGEVTDFESGLRGSKALSITENLFFYKQFQVSNEIDKLCIGVTPLSACTFQSSMALGVTEVELRISRVR